MCEQCLTEAETVVTDIVPGFHLMVATRGSQHWQQGWYGLVEMNDPSLVFEGPLLKDPTFGWSDEAINASTPEVDEEQERFFAAVEKFEAALQLDAMTGYRLVSACMKAGYLPREDGSLQYWLMHRMATQVAQQPQAA